MTEVRGPQQPSTPPTGAGAGRAEGAPAPAPGREEKARQAFQQLDADDDGRIQRDELRAAGGDLLVDAGDGPVDWKTFRDRELRPPSFNLMDRNRDGKLTGAERRHARGLDADRDGQVTKREYLDGRDDAERKLNELSRAERFDRLDRDDDGTLAGREAARLGAAYDRDGDGAVSEAEFERGMAREAAERRRAHGQAAFDRLDQDGDGKLSRAEGPLIGPADADGRGGISPAEFLAFMADYRKARHDRSRIQLHPDERAYLEALANQDRVVQTADGPMVERQGELISPRIVDAFDRMVADAAKAGVHLQINNAYRSYEEQVVLWNRYGQDPARVARPGTSNHQTGTAIDFEDTPGAFAWLKANAHRYGLQNYDPEPWHYSLDGH